jgi:hypothetical protein
VIGFALGTIRVLLLVPCLGETAAVSLEAIHACRELELVTLEREKTRRADRYR